ncbi:hypothetical protein [Methylovulum psychrotolerans]|uniref:Uncharacterized protein n=1 Tax=Methylovulum psychrotolerans TaxID=1704499 RepID=A0A2S5CQX5_9GAMM|nr:hypothetical protein [Methylovulum psychrotolerans]POZ53219.1 hypothetical protein AADEFJLK_00237 [Methylovulum psychrotolerans]
MINAQPIYYKAHVLDAVRLQGLGDFLEVLLSHSPVSFKLEAVVPATQWEAAALAVYQGKPLTEADMQLALEWESIV